MHMLLLSLILLTTIMNAFVSHECMYVWFIVCLYGAALTLKTNFYNLAETTFLHFFFFSKCFVFFSVIFELLLATFQVFLSTVLVVLLDLITTKFTLNTDENRSDLNATFKQKQDKNVEWDVCSRVSSSSSSSSFVELWFINNTLYFVQVSTMPLLILHDLNDLIHKNKNMTKNLSTKIVCLLWFKNIYFLFISHK